MQQAVRTLTAVALAAALAVPAVVLAGGNTSGADFTRMDADQDGRISATEHSAGLEQKFARLDTDGNGRVSSSELSAKGKADHFARLDTDADGELSRQEFTARAQFANMDSDGDGFLSRNELEADATAMSEGEQDSDTTAQDWE